MRMSRITASSLPPSTTNNEKERGGSGGGRERRRFSFCFSKIWRSLLETGPFMVGWARHERASRYNRGREERFEHTVAETSLLPNFAKREGDERERDEREI